MTEENAKKLWCPFAIIEGTHAAYTRKNYEESTAFGVDATGVDDARACFGSACGMWVWNSGSEVEGYCGLRGKVVIP